MTKKWTVSANAVRYECVEAEVTADSLEEAEEIAAQLDDNAWKTVYVNQVDIDDCIVSENKR